MSTPIALSDEEFATISAASHPLARAYRAAFLAECMRTLAALPVEQRGDGALYRIVMTIQRRYINDPIARGPNNERKTARVRGWRAGDAA